MRVIAETYTRDSQGHLHKKRRFVLPYDLGEYRELSRKEMEVFVSRHLNIGSVVLHGSCERFGVVPERLNIRRYFFWCNAVTAGTLFFLGMTSIELFEVIIYFDHESEEKMTTLNYCETNGESIADLVKTHGQTEVYDFYLAGQADSYLFGLLTFFKWDCDSKGRFIAPSNGEAWEAEVYDETKSYPKSWFRFDLVDEVQPKALEMYCGIYQQAPDGRKLTEQEYAVLRH